MALPVVKLTKGIHVMHLFYRIDRVRWAQLPRDQSAQTLVKLEALCAANTAASAPRLTTYANIGGKADLVFMLTAAELGQAGQLHRDLENCFPPGTTQRIYTYLSVTELPDWEVMAFYAMSKRRRGADNWYLLDFATRKKLMGGHARVGRRFAGRVSQLITGSSGIDDWEWGVTLMAHQVDALKEIVYEMRFDEVSARYGEFGPFYINLRLPPAALWQHLHL